MKLRTVAVAALLLLLFASGCTEVVTTGQPIAPYEAITVSGKGEIQAPPDTVEMSFGVTKQSDDADKALQEASAVGDAIIAALKTGGVKDEDIQTRYINVNPRYDNQEGRAPRIVGYDATIMVSAEFEDLGAVGKVIAAATGAGATDVMGPEFTLSEDAEARDDAIRDAVADARRRAEVMAEASGRELGKVISVSEVGTQVPYPSFRPNYSYDLAAEEFATPIEPGTLDISASVTVIFELK